MSETGDKGPAVGPQVIFGMDPDGVCTLSIGPGLEDLGVQPGELVGQNLLDVYGYDAKGVAALRRVLTGDTFTTEREFGGRRLSVFYQALLDGDGSVTGALGVATDVTEQRRIESEVRAARERASLLADLSAALTREVLDPEALLRVAVHVATEAVAEVGEIWVRTPDGRRLEAREVRHFDDGSRARLPRLSAEGVEALDVAQAVEPDGDEREGFGLPVRLRMPLRSRGVLVGVVDVARRAGGGPFTEAEVALVADIAERCALALDNALLLRAQQEAREELVKFQALADASGNQIAITDTDSRPVYVNPRVTEAGLDLSADDVWAAVRTYAGDPTQAAIREALATENRWSGDVTLAAPSGEVVLDVDAFSLSHPDTGAALGTGWIGQDVTALRSAEAALREANSDLKQFKALVETSPDFIAIAGLDGRLKYVNPPGRELAGIPADVDVTSTTIADYLTAEAFDVSVRVEQPAVLAHGRWEGESTLRNWRGGTIPVAIASFLIHDAESGEPFALATVQRDLTERLAAETALRQLADQRQALLTRLVDAQDAERARIAADVHDDPVQALAAVDLRLGLLRRRLRTQAPDLLESLRPVQESVSGATDRLRALLFDLEPPDLQSGLTGALRKAADEVFENSTIRPTVDGTREPDAPDATRAIAYRIAKEAMVNALKHASAQTVVVTVAGRDGGLEVSVADDGVGLGAEPIESAPGHRGLFSMQDRAAVAGGRCVIGNLEPRGTLVTVWLPLPVPGVN